MASAFRLLEDIDDKFCQCCLCFKQYKDPRLLPCLHRYCSECLQEIIDISHDEFNCPLCQEPLEIPENGVEGLKKDFYMNEIIEYVEVKKSLKETKLHKCGDCSKQVKATAYCFRCTDFLCEGCHEYHMTKKSLQEHRPHILTLTDVESKNITLEHLSSLKEAPRCQTHLDNVSHLCCKTCGNLPICLACTYGSHKKHEIEDVIYFAERERDRLKQSLRALADCKDGVYKMAERIKGVRGEILANSESKIEDLKQRYQSQNEKLEAQRIAVRETQKCEEEKIAREQNHKEYVLNGEMEKRIKQIRKEYGDKISEVKEETLALLSGCTQKYEKEQRVVENKKEKIQKGFESVSTVINDEKERKINENDDISQHLKSTIERFENLTAISSNILESKNNWTTVQNIDGICQAAEPLARDMKREFPDMGKMSRFTESTLMMGRFGWSGKVTISYRVEKVQDIEGIPGGSRYIEGITCTGSGDIVVSGDAGGGKAHITVTNIRGERIKQRVKDTGMSSTDRYCFCAAYKTSKVIIACNNEVGIYDTRDGSYHNKVLSQVVGDSSPLTATCVTSDDTDDTIIVGCLEDPNLYFLNERLELIRKLRLPGGMSKPGGITVKVGDTVVCAGGTERACVVDMNGGILHEFTKTNAVGRKTPFRICVDSNGYLYVLWGDNVDMGRGSCCVITQYSPDDYRLLCERSVGPDVWLSSMTTAMIGDTEKLLVSTIEGGKMHVYGLYEE